MSLPPIPQQSGVPQPSAEPQETAIIPPGQPGSQRVDDPRAAQSPSITPAPASTVTMTQGAPWTGAPYSTAAYAPPQSWAAIPGGGAHGAAAPADDPARAMRRANTALGWAIGALVAGLIAFVVGIGAVIYAATIAADATPLDEGNPPTAYDDGTGSDGWQSGYPVWGTVEGFSLGGDITGAQMVTAATDALESAGADVDEITCPDSTAVNVSSVVACAASYDGIDNWSLIVYVIDDQGAILVTSY